MFEQSQHVGFDIETNTDGVNALDARESNVTDIALVTEDEERVFSLVDYVGDPYTIGLHGDPTLDAELALLLDLDAYLRRLPAMLLDTWNGTFFDNPFIWTRWSGFQGADLPPLASSHRAALARAGRPDPFGMNPIVQTGLAPKYQLPPGYTTGLSCEWTASGSTQLYGVGGTAPRQHTHLDVAYGYKRYADEHNMSWGLKPMAKAHGIAMFDATGKPYEDKTKPGEVDRNLMHLMSPEERHEYVVSDARATRLLGIRLLGADQGAAAA